MERMGLREEKWNEEGELMNPSYPGSNKSPPPGSPLIHPMPKRVDSSSIIQETLPMLNDSFSSPKLPQAISPPRSGTISYAESLSTSTPSSAHSTVFQLLKRALDASDELRLIWESQNPSEGSKPAETGLQPTPHTAKRPRLLSPIDSTNLLSIKTTLRGCSQPNSPLPTDNSFCLTLPFETMSQEVKAVCSPIITNSSDITRPLSCPMEWNQAHGNAPRHSKLENGKFASGSIHPKDVQILTQPARVDTHAEFASDPDTIKALARLESDLTHGLKPKYLRYNLWRTDGEMSPNSADWSEHAPPLPRIPTTELSNPVVARTIDENSHLFKIVTPINVDRFEELLLDHPNPAFVESVCYGLRNGFWPWANTHQGVYPVTHDASRAPPSDPARNAFLSTQRDLEVQKGRFSESFGTSLLPGMYCMPIHAVPKPHSTDLRMVTDQSAGEYSLNSMMHREDSPSYPLDNMRHLGEMLLAFRKKSSARLTMFKSDIAEAYRLMPVHPFWQIKQINLVNGSAHVDRNCTFGGRKSGDIFVSFNSLVTWIAHHVKGIPFLAAYCDDSFGFTLEDDVTYYTPYGKFLPSPQATLLSLWDELSIPHKEKKQISGSPLVIIGIDVDPNLMTLTLPASARSDLLAELDKFCTRKGSRSRSFPLKVWQRLAGWLNWAFNVFPLLRPCLNNVYPKLAGKELPNQQIWVNNSIRSDLTWAAEHIRLSDGIHLIRAVNWDPSQANVTIFSDACLEGMAFYYPELSLGYFAHTPSHLANEHIFVFEALAVVSAIQHTIKSADNAIRIVVFTDNSNTVSIFNTLRCLPFLNPLLKTVADILLTHPHELRVLHVPGECNVIADAISRSRFNVAIDADPFLTIHTFEPPRLTLGAVRK